MRIIAHIEVATPREADHLLRILRSAQASLRESGSAGVIDCTVTLDSDPAGDIVLSAVRVVRQRSHRADPRHLGSSNSKKR